jgi:hypothetical protein
VAVSETITLKPGPDIKVELQHYMLKIWINGLLHLAIPRGRISVQSWRDGPHHFSIQYYLENGQCITSEYDDAEKWKMILRGLDDQLHL